MTKPAYCCDKLSPEAPLGNYVEYFYVLRGHSCHQETAEPWFPGGAMDMIFDLGAPFEQGVASEPMKTRPGSFVAGLFECGLRIRPTGDIHQIGVVFKPGRFRQFIRGHQTEFKGEIVPLKDVFGYEADDLVDRLHHLNDDTQRIHLVQSFLIQSFRPQVKDNPFVEYCADTIRAHPGEISLKDLSKSARISSRHFRRLFKEYVGISPKLYCILMRLDILIRDGLSNSLNLNQISDELGYYDSSHLARDFKGISGMSLIDFIKSPNLIAKTFISS